jgi:hypothetical protein
MALVTRNGLWLSRKGPALPDPLDPAGALPDGALRAVPYDGLLQAMAQGEMRLEATADVVMYSGGSNVLLGAGGAPGVVAVGSNSVVVNAAALAVLGPLVVVGVTDGASNTAGGEAALDGAGLQLASDLDASDAYEKSLRWRAGEALARAGRGGLATALAPGAASNAPLWEALGGGHLRVTAPGRATAAGVAFGPGAVVSYGLVVDQLEMLELYKRATDGLGGETFQRLLQAGSTLAGRALTLADLPTSVNPYY